MARNEGLKVQTGPIVTEVEALLDQLEEILNEAKRIPWGRQALVDAAAMKVLLDQVRRMLPEEMRQAQWVVKERDRILEEAGQEADSLRNSAQARVEVMADDAEVVRAAKSRAKEIIQAAEQSAQEIHRGALQYVDEVLEGLDNEIGRIQQTIRANRDSLKPPE